MEKHREKLACRDLAEQGHYPIGTDSIEQIRELLEMLVSDDLDEGLTTIEVLGEIGDEGTLKALRAQMTLVGKEYHALVIAVGKLKKRLGVK